MHNRMKSVGWGRSTGNQKVPTVLPVRRTRPSLKEDFPFFGSLEKRGKAEKKPAQLEGNLLFLLHSRPRRNQRSWKIYQFFNRVSAIFDHVRFSDQNFYFSKVVRLSIAQVLTAISQTQKSVLREAYKNKKFLPLDLRPKKARAIRRRLSKHQNYMFVLWKTNALCIFKHAMLRRAEKLASIRNYVDVADLGWRVDTPIVEPLAVGEDLVLPEDISSFVMCEDALKHFIADQEQKIISSHVTIEDMPVSAEDGAIPGFNYLSSEQSARLTKFMQLQDVHRVLWESLKDEEIDLVLSGVEKGLFAADGEDFHTHANEVRSAVNPEFGDRLAKAIVEWHSCFAYPDSLAPLPYQVSVPIDCVLPLHTLPWTPAEVELLIKGVEEIGIGRWQLLKERKGLFRRQVSNIVNKWNTLVQYDRRPGYSQHRDGLSLQQLRRVKEANVEKPKEPWNQGEVDKLVRAVEEYGTGSWRDVQHHMQSVRGVADIEDEWCTLMNHLNSPCYFLNIGATTTWQLFRVRAANIVKIEQPVGFISGTMEFITELDLSPFTSMQKKMVIHFLYRKDVKCHLLQLWRLNAVDLFSTTLSMRGKKLADIEKWLELGTEPLGDDEQNLLAEDTPFFSDYEESLFRRTELQKDSIVSSEHAHNQVLLFPEEALPLDLSSLTPEQSARLTHFMQRVDVHNYLLEMLKLDIFELVLSRLEAKMSAALGQEEIEIRRKELNDFSSVIDFRNSGTGAEKDVIVNRVSNARYPAGFAPQIHEVFVPLIFVEPTDSKWTNEELELLIEGVEEVGIGKWELVKERKNLFRSLSAIKCQWETLVSIDKGESWLLGALTFEQLGRVRAANVVKVAVGRQRRACGVESLEAASAGRNIVERMGWDGKL
ncbi:unnamed protein product [Linum tenue]|uniref:Myb-like domain-containing protein n=1 Tax=Linum tenue TaxID=586396 RepID=A0AAV0JR78_9ROSI|nr:unnamed protein product [Linum tenue]